LALIIRAQEMRIPFPAVCAGELQAGCFVGDFVLAVASFLSLRSAVMEAEEAGFALSGRWLRGCWYDLRWCADRFEYLCTTPCPGPGLGLRFGGAVELWIACIPERLRYPECNKGLFDVEADSYWPLYTTFHVADGHSFAYTCRAFLLHLFFWRYYVLKRLVFAVYLLVVAG
jgi:hypothetical protein